MSVKSVQSSSCANLLVETPRSSGDEHKYSLSAVLEPILVLSAVLGARIRDARACAQERLHAE